MATQLQVPDAVTYQRHLAAGLVRYSYAETQIAAGELVAALDDWHAAQDDAARMLMARPNYEQYIGWLADEPKAVRQVALLAWENPPDEDVNGTSTNPYPIVKWATMARSLRRAAKRLQTAVAAAQRLS